jgi:hypothetical protein
VRSSASCFGFEGVQVPGIANVKVAMLRASDSDLRHGWLRQMVGCAVCAYPVGCHPANFCTNKAPPERGDGRSRPNANPGQTMGSFSGLARLAAATLSFPPTALLERVVWFGISHWYRDSEHCRYDGKRTCCDVMSLMGFCRLTTHFGARSLRSKVRASPSGEYVNVVRTPSTRYDTPRPALLV